MYFDWCWVCVEAADGYSGACCSGRLGAAAAAPAGDAQTQVAAAEAGDARADRGSADGHRVRSAGPAPGLAQTNLPTGT